jgi:hypothetical protein
MYHCAFCMRVCEHVCLRVHLSVAEFSSGSDQNDPQQNQCPAV